MCVKHRDAYGAVPLCWTEYALIPSQLSSFNGRSPPSYTYISMMDSEGHFKNDTQNHSQPLVILSE